MAYITTQLCGFFLRNMEIGRKEINMNDKKMSQIQIHVIVVFPF